MVANDTLVSNVMFLREHVKHKMTTVCIAGGTPVFDLNTGQGVLSFEDDGCFQCLQQRCAYFNYTAFFSTDDEVPLVIWEATILLQREGDYKVSYFLENGIGFFNSWTAKVTMTDPPFARDLETLTDADSFGPTYREYFISIPQPGAVIKLAFYGAQVRLPRLPAQSVMLQGGNSDQYYPVYCEGMARRG